jgi:hypothetical protein
VVPQVEVVAVEVEVVVAVAVEVVVVQLAQHTLDPKFRLVHQYCKAHSIPILALVANMS